GTDIRVVEVPGDASKTPVLLLHGIASVTAAAIPLIPAFDGARVIALDWPGHGLSGPHRFTTRTDLRAFAVEVIDAVADAYGLDSFDIVGHSLGGQFALYYCLSRAERVRRMVLVGAPGAAFEEMRPPAGMRAVAFPGVGAWLLRRPVTREQYGANSAQTLGPGAVDPWPAELVDVGYLASLRRAFHETLPGLFRAIARFSGMRRGVAIPHEQLATITVPTLFLWGDKDVFLSPEDARPSWSAMPGAQLVEVSAGHAPWLNKPEESAEAVRAFLA
ncbi:MAG: alpha/beta hydrolase, partial [Rhodoglobus sp.]|nr:alpha/beta hydrolase [Rhodoglobus sp.]